MLKFLRREKKTKRNLHEIAPQLTRYERRSLEVAGIPPGGLPYAVYDQMEKDSMVQTVLTLKKLGVSSSAFRIDPADDSPAARQRVEFIEDVFAHMEGSPLTILSGAMDAFCKGWSVQEMVFGSDGKRLVLRSVKPKDPSLFGLEVDAYGTIRGLKLQVPGESPLDLPRDKFIVYTNRASYGQPKGRSDLDAAYRHWHAKQALLAAWRLHLERFASPTILGAYQRGMATEEQAEILGNLETLSQRTAILYANEVVVNTLGGDKEASTGFQEAIDFHNREIARCVLGQTLTTDEGRRVGSLALGKVHMQVLLLQLEAVRRDPADRVMTEQVIRPLVELNFGPGLLPRFVFEPSPASAFATGAIS